MAANRGLGGAAATRGRRPAIPGRPGAIPAGIRARGGMIGAYPIPGGTMGPHAGCRPKPA
jgi:hypothetical protein